MEGVKEAYHFWRANIFPNKGKNMLRAADLAFG